MKGSSIVLIAVTSSLVAAFVALGKCAYDRHLRADDSLAMRFGAEDIARRLGENRESSAAIRSLYDHAVLAAARSVAQIVADDPTVLTDTNRFAALARDVGVDEVHVSDERGILIASIPDRYRGFDMASREQSAAFLPAITNRAFELVQPATRNGIEGALRQYAGVARRVHPGIVQVGLYPERLDAVLAGSDPRHVEATARVGSGGRVKITELPAGETGDGRPRMAVTDGKKNRIATLTMEANGYRIAVSLPYVGWRLADDRPYELLEFSIVLLLVLMLLCGFRIFGWHGVLALAGELKVLFAPARGAFRPRRVGPVAVIAIAIFAIGIVVTWKVSDRASEKYASGLLRSGADEFTNDFKAAPEDGLFFVGRAIIAAYPTPDSFKECNLKSMLREFAIDELNVVDGNGLIVASTMSGNVIGQNQWTLPGPRAFCEELITNGELTFAQPFRESASEPGIFRMYAGVAFPAAKGKPNGYIQIGFDEKRIARNLDYVLEDLAHNWTLGESGYFVLARDSGEIVSCGRRDYEEIKRDGTPTLAGVGFDTTQIPKVTNECFTATLFGETCRCLARKLGNYHQMLAVMPEDEIASGRDRTVMFIAVLLFVVLAIVTVFGTRLTDLVDRLRTFIAEDKRRRAEELRNAKAIQTESLPLVFPEYDDYKIYARMDTAKEVGGDFYDFYTLPSGRQLFLIADTSGKGIPAAMFMMKAKAVVRAGLFEAPDFATAIIEANNRLAENNDANMFVTAWIGVFDRETGEVEFVNCGHNPPLVKHADGSVSWVRSRPGLALAAMGGVKYRVEKLTLAPGESLFLYTDGVTEAMNGKGEQYGERRLEADLTAAPRFKFVDLLREKVAAFVAGAEQSDDITMLALDRK